MKYGLFIRGKLIRLVPSLKEILTSRAYEPWNGAEVYEFKYNSLGMPVEAKKI